MKTKAFHTKKIVLRSTASCLFMLIALQASISCSKADGKAGFSQGGTSGGTGYAAYFTENTASENVLSADGASGDSSSAAESRPQAEGSLTASAQKSAQKSSQKVDFDLTKMSATMIYSTVFDMLIAPEDYENKNIKIQGMFNVFTNEATGDRYFTVLVPDATACCQQGLEFVWLGDHSYPEDYPPEFSEITVVGSYTTVEEDGISYSYLQVENIES